jgi:thiol-disulfide isomerase/thioredoxin
MRIVFKIASIIIPLLLVVGCQQQPPPQKMLWRGDLALPGEKQLPFYFYLDLTPPAPSGYFVNGSEQTPIPEVYQRGDSLIFVFSEYGAVMQSIWKNNQLTGKYFRFRKDTVVNNFVAMPLETRTEVTKSKSTPAMPLVGKYQVYIKNRDGIDSSTQATFWSRGDSVFGTFVAADGDYGLMAGMQTGNGVQLGRFTGWQGQLMELTRDQNDWTGTLYYRLPPAIPFSLRPRSTLLAEVSASKRTTVIEPRKPFSFSGVTVMGDTITNLDSRFKGKALIIDVMGTWCHNCMDGTPVLQKLYSELSSQGLEVMGLSFEITADARTARKNMLLYEERYGVTFPVLFCGSLDNGNVQARIRSQLNNFYAYPTTIFVDKKGVVRYIHEGFNGPGTGEAYQSQIDFYYATVKDLLKGGLARK